MRAILASLVLVLAACNSPQGGAPNTPAPGAPAASASPAAPAAPAASGGGSVGGDVPAVVATINGSPVSKDQLEAKASSGVIEAMQKLYGAREQALDEIIIETLLDAEAKKRSISRDDLLKAEVEAKVAQPTDADMMAFYEQNKARIGAEFEMVKDKIAMQLSRQKQGERMRAYIDELKAAAKVETFLEPYRVEVPKRDGAAIKGAATAPVKIVEFSDFQCPYCTKGAEVMKQVMAKYGDKVSFEYRHFPLGFHNRAHRAAEAAECAGEQGKFWEMHDALFANQGKLEDPDLIGYATTIGADKAKFEACLTSGAKAKVVDDDMKMGEKVGMSGTPGFYVNGRMISGAMPLEAFVEIIDAELKKQG